MRPSYLKGPAILVRNSDGLAISTTDGISIDQSVKTVEVQDQFGGPQSRFISGIEHIITFTPHGILDATRIGAFFPFLNAKSGDVVYTDQSWTIYGQDGYTRTYPNFALKVQPTLDVGVNKPNVFGQITCGGLMARSGGSAGSVFVDGAARFPGFSFVNVNGLFRSGALLSWFKDRTTGRVQATGTLTATVNFADGETVTAGTVVRRFKTVMAAINDVQLGVDLATSLANLKKTENGTGVAGTHYFAGTLPNPDLLGDTLTGTTLLYKAILGGTAGNSLATTETCANASFATATLTGGTEAQADTNTVGYVADPADIGWRRSRTSEGIKITPTQKLTPEPDSEAGDIGNYTLSETGVEIDCVVLDVTEKAYGAGTSSVVGATLEKGDALVVAGDSPNQLRFTARSCGFTGGSKMWHKDNKRLGAVKLMSTTTYENGVQLPHGSLVVV